ncbi:DUF3164 family protein [Alkalimonas mucilaginosa]|uniref:DUF3164 family protein n=1 Tax=Alkalimonas mucilaginosa TaxID=3057676 RepID=A0ABU7JHC8_9GAMM|nr:DUF3164 family protein [Alkalimonas sp. MEB004]MEE2025057.1 DUF3164 family protein [Alkalimonas sp. MEB004]
MNKNTDKKAAIPAGYWQDAKGALIPEKMIRPIDRARDDLVRELVTKAQELSALLADYKRSSFADIAAFIQLSAEQYKANIGGKKGNVTLYSFDGKYKVVRAISETISFDERLQAAKSLIDTCLRDWTASASDELKAIVKSAFDADKQGNISTGRVLALRRLDIKDERWQQAMAAIGEAIQVIGSKSYIRVYERIGDTDQYRPIPLDLAAVSL